MNARAATGYDELYTVRRDELRIVDVPELRYASVSGQGDPNGPEFAAAVQTLFAVGYGAHFLARKQLGAAPSVMPLEALWWFDDADRAHWRWQALIMQPPPLDAELLGRAVEQAHARGTVDVRGLSVLTWTEGRCAQILHIGPYAEEEPSIRRLHEGIAAAGYRPRGQHHEIYLGDPRRSAPDKLRTILRRPIEPV